MDTSAEQGMLLRNTMLLLYSPDIGNRCSRKLGCMRIQQLAYATAGTQTGALRRPVVA